MAPIKRIATDAQGRYAVTASDDKTARVWEIATGRLLQTLRVPIGPGDEGKLYAVALSPDGETVALGGFTNATDSHQSIYLFARSSGQMRARFSGLPNVVSQLSYSPDGRWLAACLWNGGLRVYDSQQGAAQTPLADRDYGGTCYGAAWRQDGWLATSSFDGKLRLYQISQAGLQRKQSVAAPSGKLPFQLHFSPDGKRLAVGYSDSRQVDVLDGDSLEKLYAPDVSGVDNGNLGRVAFSADGRSLVATGSWKKDGKTMLRLWAEGGRGAYSDLAVSENTVMDIQPLPQTGWLLAASDPAWGVLQESMQTKSRASIANLFGNRNAALLVDETGRSLSFGFAGMGREPWQFDMAQRKLSPGQLKTGHAPRTDGLPLTNWEDNTRPVLKDLALTLHQGETSRSLALDAKAERFVLGADWSLRQFDASGKQAWEKPVPGASWGVNIPRAGRVVVVAYGDGTLRWHRLSDGQELLAFFPHGDRKRWVLWTPGGYYDASPGAEELIGWHINRGPDRAADFYPAARFRERFYRPDVIDLVLDTLDEGEALRLANENRPQALNNKSIAQSLPPTLHLQTPADIRSSSERIRIQARADSAADAPIKRWFVRIDGVKANLSVAAQSQFDQEISIPREDCTVELFAENKYGVSNPLPVRVTWQGRAPSAAANLRLPLLRILAIGVSDYPKGIPPLQFAHKDAQDFIQFFQAQKGVLYRDVHITPLLNGNATRDAITRAMQALEEQVKGSDDVTMVFFSGHGEMAGNGKLFFLPADVKPDNLRGSAIRHEEVLELVSSLRGKALVFLDACRSGGGKKAAESFDITRIVNEMGSAQSGAVVFASSTGREFSLEKSALQNGVFTAALLEGLRGAAAEQGKITHGSLRRYLEKRVPALSGDAQHPSFLAPQSVQDFPIAVQR
ncbi:caspase family protein [Massilia sp. W12]|uniref:caspase family protein n=1 Tax=Massilia sp. W12 TaxID=3126507 RepID=UPI0030CDAE55